MNRTLDTRPTIQWHRHLAEALPARRRDFASSLAAANDAMRMQHLALSRDKPLEVALSALLLSAADVRSIATLSEKLHALIEHVLDTVLQSGDLLPEHFADMRRIAPFFARTRGAESWQVLSRYDAAVTADGQLKIMELNTACPGALLISEKVALVTRHGLEQIDELPADCTIGNVLPSDVRDELLRIERQAGMPPAMIGILYDENALSFELDDLVDAFRAASRDARIVDARTLQLRGGRLYHDGHELSLIYNKFRISTPHSPNHCWQDGFESRYEAFLEAQQSGQVVSVNNLVGMTIAESKRLLALLHDSEFRRTLSDSQCQLIDDHVLWTAALADGEVELDGQAIDLLPHVRRNRDRFVIKPANEGRGYGVTVGRCCTQDQWESACRVRDDLPQIVQQYVEALQFPVICQRGGQIASQPMYLTLGLATLSGRYAGLVSRISANPVTNVAREGFGQAVFVQ